MYTRSKMRRNYQNYNIFCAHSQLWNIQQYDNYMYSITMMFKRNKARVFLYVAE